MPNDLDTLLRAVLLSPGDDVARLAYADALEEAGQADRAEFVRIQCQLYSHQDAREWLEQMPVEQWGGSAAEGDRLRRLDPLVRRHSELCRLYVNDCVGWSRDFAKSVCGPDYMEKTVAWQWGWARGFVESWECDLEAFLSHAGAVFSMHPITEVAMTDREPLLIPAVYRGQQVRAHDEYHWYGTVHTAGNQGGLPYAFFVAEPVSRAVFRGEDDALRWLSRACVRYGRQLAGLPPLPVEAAP